MAKKQYVVPSTNSVWSRGRISIDWLDEGFPIISIVLICTMTVNEKSTNMCRKIPRSSDDMIREIGYAQFRPGETWPAQSMFMVEKREDL